MKTLLISMLFLSFVTHSKEYSVKSGKSKVNVLFDIKDQYEVKEKFLNTPLLIWDRKLKHHGPSIGIFPIENFDKNIISANAKVTNFEKFKKKNTENLKSLNATNIKFAEAKYAKNQISYAFSYTLPGNIKVYSTETFKSCLPKGIKIKSVVKTSDYKKFRNDLSDFLMSVKCTKGE